MRQIRGATVRSWMSKHSAALTVQGIWLAYGIYNWNNDPFFLWLWAACWVAFAIFLIGRRLIAKT